MCIRNLGWWYKKIKRFYSSFTQITFKKGKNSFVAKLIPDDDDETGKNPVRDNVYISLQFIRRVEAMNI